jgi:probable HAF family extracellular repeat protein
MHLRFILIAVATAIPAAASAQPVYNLYDLGDLGSLQGLTSGWSSGQSVNISGQVAGFALSPDLHSVAFRTGPTGLGSGSSSLMGLDTDARGINVIGQVTGQIQVGPNGPNGAAFYHPYRTSPTGSASDPGADLGTLPGGTVINGDSKGFAINASGQVAGVAFDTANRGHAFRTTATGTLSDPGADLGLGAAYAINDSGQVTGSMGTASGNAHAYRTTATGKLADPGTDLGTLGGAGSTGYAINSSGQVTGSSTTTTGYNHAFRTTATGNVSDPGTDLGTLPGFTSSAGFGIDALGEVVGQSAVVGGPTHAFLYTTQMWDLNNLIQPGTVCVLTRAYGMNDDGWITGISAANRGFLLIPADSDPGVRTPVQVVPEPSTLALTGAAIMFAWAVRRQRLALSSVTVA